MYFGQFMVQACISTLHIFAYNMFLPMNLPLFGLVVLTLLYGCGCELQA